MKENKDSKIWTKDIYILTNLELFMFVFLNLKYEKKRNVCLVCEQTYLKYLSMISKE